MNFSFDLPVRIVSGKDCIKNNADLLGLGKTAFIVTGKSGARLSGALGDVCATLDALKINYRIMDNVAENPPLETCFHGGRTASEIGADFVIGIGGGSAIDAAKAVAAFATNQNITMDELFDAERRTQKALPIIAIPTTSGTGSEANSYSVLSLPDGLRKKTFSARDSWPTVAFLDPKYTYSLSTEQTMSTALDAFAHALESYLSPKSTEISELLAIYAANNIWSIIKDDPDVFTEEAHEILLCASCAAGIAISITGTGFPHPLGYSLTMLHGIPHGRACAIFDGDFIKYNMRSEEGEKRLTRFAKAIGDDVDVIAEKLPKLAKINLRLSSDAILDHVDLIAEARNYFNSPYVISKREMIEIYRSHFA